MSQGWIKIHRQMKNCWIYEDKPFDRTHAWIDLLIRANHQDKKVALGTEFIEVKRGSFITSEVKLMDSWGWSKSKLRGFLKLLQDDGMIEIIADKKKTTINIVNYSVYQGLEDQENTIEKPMTDQEKTIKELKKDTNKNDKELKNEKNEKNDKENILSDYTDNLELIESIKDFITMRKQIKKPMTEKAIRLMLNKLDSLSKNDYEKIAILNQSIVNSWQGIFELKERYSGQYKLDNKQSKESEADRLAEYRKLHGIGQDIQDPQCDF